MTIFKSVSIPDLATGTTLVSLGFAEYNALKADLTYQTTVPNWRRDTATLDSLLADASSTDLSLQPRALWDQGSAIVRTEAQLRMPASFNDNEYAILLGKDDKNFIAVFRSFFGTPPAATEYLQFVLVQGGVVQAATSFPYQIYYNSGFTLNQYTTLPASLTVAAVVVGSTIEIYVNGIKQYLRNSTSGATNITSIPMPSAVAGATKAGYWRTVTGNKRFAPYLAIRDNAGRTDINSYKVRRANTTQSKIRVGVFCNVSGASTVQVDIYNASGTLIGSGGGAIVSGQATVDIGPLPNDQENAWVDIRARNLGGVEDRSAVAFFLPSTIPQQAFKLGQNETSYSYFSGMYPYNDIGRMICWRDSKFNRSYWMDLSPSLYPTSASWNAASVMGIQPNGSPTAWPSGGVISSQLPWYNIRGTYIMDMTGAPDVTWAFQQTFGHVTVDLEYYGYRKHRVIIDTDAIASATGGHGAGDSNFGIFLTKNTALPNGGLPTTEWTTPITIRLVGTDDAMVWRKEIIDWLTESGISHLRYMGNQVCNYVGAAQRGALSAASRPKPTDQLWLVWFIGGGADYAPAHPHEHLTQLHNHVQIPIYDCLSRLADESYVRARYQYFYDNLDPSIPIIVETGNETWNTAFRQYIDYLLEGLAAGWGRKISAGCLEDAVYSDAPGSYTIPANWSISTAYVTGNQVVYNANIWEAKTSVAAGGAVPVNGANWQKIQDGEVARRRAHIKNQRANLSYIEDIFGADYATRIIPVACCWNVGFDGDFPEYLEWGDNWQHIDYLLTGRYYGGGSVNTFAWANLTADQKTAVQTLSGDARIEVLKQIARPAMELEIERFPDHQRKIDAKLIALGGSAGAVKGGSYEAGQHWLVSLYDTSISDKESLRVDILNFYRNGLYDLEYDFFDGLRERVGGLNTKFSMVSPSMDDFATVTSFVQFWGVSVDLNDRETSSNYRAIRDLAVAYAGGTVETLPFPGADPPVPGGGFGRYPVGYFLE